MSKRMDLHTHTKASDGTCEPAENVRLAKKAGLAGLAITDHDTVAGIPAALEAAIELGVEVIPGIEVSSSARGQDIHVLGYFVPYEDAAFQARLVGLRETRHERHKLLIARLQELGIPITLEKVYSRKPGTNKDKNIGRPHIAEEMMELGVVSSIEEAFEKYLGKGGAAYVNPPRITPQEAITLIKDAGGVAVLAHPGLYDDDELVHELIEFGLDGIEVFHPDNDAAQRETYSKWAEEFDLIVTGGSDFHGWRGEEPFHAMLGSHTTAVEAVERMRELADKRRLG